MTHKLFEVKVRMNGDDLIRKLLLKSESRATLGPQLEKLEHLAGVPIQVLRIIEKKEVDV